MSKFESFPLTASGNSYDFRNVFRITCCAKVTRKG